MFTDSFVGKMHKVTSFLMAFHGLSYQETAQKSSVEVGELLNALRSPSHDHVRTYSAVIESLGYSVKDVTFTIEFMRQHSELTRFLLKIQEIDDIIMDTKQSREFMLGLPPASAVEIFPKRRHTPVRTDSERKLQEGVGQKLKDYRLLHELSQTDLAERMGVHQSSVSALERGVYAIRHSERFKAAFAKIGMDLDHMIEAEDSRMNIVHSEVDDTTVYKTLIRLPQEDQVIVQCRLANTLRQERMVRSKTLEDISAEAKTTMQKVEDMENASYPLPQTPTDATIWTRVFSTFGLSFHTMLRDMVLTEPQQSMHG